MSVLFDLVAPASCAACGSASDGDLCGRCAERIVAITEPYCARCGYPAPGTCTCADLTAVRRARSLVVFEPPARQLTLAFKRRGRADTVDAVGALLAERVRADALATSQVAYVPTGASARTTGFDHGRALARATARALDARLADVLTRASNGPRQADVGLAQRRVNVAGRFACAPIRGNVLLVDDVLTTGATVDACARALRDAGADAVDVITWARTLRRNDGRGKSR